jgi:hypothetical protein
MKTEKPIGVRVKEVVEILKKLESLGIPLESAEVQELKSHFDTYIKEEECWTGEVSFSKYGRIAFVNLPKSAKKPIEVTLKAI